MKKYLKCACAILLSILLASNCVIGAFAGSSIDNDLNMSEILDETVADTVFVNADGEEINAADEYSKVTVDGNPVEGEEATFNIEYGDGTNAYEFVGWYDENNLLVSTDETFTHTVGDYSLLTPVVKTHNVLSAGASFESINTAGSLKVQTTNSDQYFYKNGDSYVAVSTAPAPTGHLWGVYSIYSYPTYQKVGNQYIAIENPVTGAYCGDTIGSINAIVGEYQHTYFSDFDNDPDAKATVTVKPHSGNTMLSLNTPSRHSIKELDGLKKNTDYVLSVWVYIQNKTSQLPWAAVTSNYDGLKTSASYSHSDNCDVLGITGFNPNYGEWTQLKIPFNSGDNEVAYFHIGDAAGINKYGPERNSFIDDMTVCEADAVGYEGVHKLVENGNVRISGATTIDTSNIALNYTGSAIEFKANCKGTVKLEYTAVPLMSYSLRFKVIVDGVEQNDIVTKGSISGEFVLAENLTQGEHTFKLVRATENTMGSVYITGISLDGNYSNLPKNNKIYSFDFYGDSLTAGYGTTYFNGDSDWSYYEDGSKSYAYLSSNALNADARIFAYSGIGVAVGANNDGSGDTILDKYAQFPKNTNADAVVIYLGTNDIGKYTKQGLTLDAVITEFKNFIKTVRNDYANAKIIMLHYSTNDDIILPAVNQAKAEGVTELYTLEVPCGRSGGDLHPNVEEQAETSEVVTAYLKEHFKDVVVDDHIPGDIDGNDTVNLKDLVALAQHVADWDVTVDEYALDVDGDGSVDLDDVNRLARYLAGWKDANVQ